MCFRNGATLKVARRDVPLRNGIIFLSALISAAGALLLSGCSGGHSSGTPGTAPTPTPSPTPVVPAPVAVSAQIAWPARSRAATPANGTASALSAVITLTGSGTNGTVSVIANRPSGADTAAVTTTYALSGTAVPGNLYSLKVNFYAASSGSGSVVATAAQANTLLQSDGTLKATVITTATNVSTVTVRDVAATGSTTGLAGVIGVGQTVDVLYSLYDSGGNLLAAPPADYGSGFVTVADSTKLTAPSTAGDQVKGIAPSTGTTFTVNVDGVTSNPFTAKVLSTEKIAITPSPATVSPGIAQVFAASATTLPAADTTFGVTWTFVDSSGSTPTTGTIASTTTTFTYTPPSTIPPTVGPYKLTATSIYDPNVSFTTTVTVASLVAVAITPNPATTISLKQTEVFNFTVTNDPTAAGVTWSVTGGSLSTTTTTPGTSVTYTAPATTGTYTLTATSIFDPSKSASIPITVNSAITVAITPAKATPLSFKQSEAFTATIPAGVDPTNSGLTWTILDSSGKAITNGGIGGTLSATSTPSGTATTYTASTTPGVYTLVAASVLDPTKTASVAVTVSSTISVSITPHSPNPISINDASLNFTATIPAGLDPANQGVVWTIQDSKGNTLPNGGSGGTLSATATTSGVPVNYKAPASVTTPAGTVFIIIATSVLDPTKSDRVNVTVGSGNVNVPVS